MNSHCYKIIKELRNHLFLLKSNLYKNNLITEEIQQNLFNLSTSIIELENNYTGLSSRSSSEYSFENLEFNDLPVLNVDLISKKMNDWNFDFFSFQNSMDLVIFTYFMFTDIFDFDNLKINLNSLHTCIIEISKKYNNNPYHNFQHAVTVTHFIYLIIKTVHLDKYLSKYKLFGLLFSGLVHDIDHPGTDNLFEANKKSFLSLQYNDKSILENHHCSTAFFIMQQDNIKLFKNLNNVEFTEIRNTIIESILSTDMKNHSTLISYLKSSNIIENELLLCKLIIHASDLCNQLKCFDVYKNGIKRIHKEMLNQKEKEKKLCLPITKNIDINNNNELIQNEINFSIYFVKPIWSIIINLFPELTFLINEHDNNINILLSNNYSLSESESET